MTKENYKEFMDSLIVQKNPNHFLVLSFMVNLPYLTRPLVQS